MSEKIKKLKNFLCENYNTMEYEGGGGTEYSIPNFDLYSRDYLKFAEKSLDDKTAIGLINCVSNLKRAMDCQIDMFFYKINLYDLIKRRNLKMGQKLNFLESIGLFSSRSLENLNHVRNKMEHNYQIPNISEITLYFELVEALIITLENSMAMMDGNRELIFTLHDDKDSKLEVGYFSIEYIGRNKYPYIEVNLKEKDKEEENIVANIKTEMNEFIYFCKMFFLLYKISSIGSKEYLLENIKQDI